MVFKIMCHTIGADLKFSIYPQEPFWGGGNNHNNV